MILDTREWASSVLANNAEERVASIIDDTESFRFAIPSEVGNDSDFERLGGVKRYKKPRYMILTLLRSAGQQSEQ